MPDRTAADARAPLMPRPAVEEARRELTRWTDDGQGVLARVARAFGEHEALCAALEAARDDGARLRAALEAARDDGAQLREQVTALEADVATFRARLAALHAEHADLARVVTRGLQGMLSQVLPQVPDGGEARPMAVPVLAPGEAADLGAAPDAVVPATAPRGSPGATGVGRGGPEEPEAALALDSPAVPTAEEATRILLVDDEPHFTELIAEFLGERGFEVQIASSGEQAIEVLPAFGPRIVLLDLMMPGISGMEALRRIKAMRPETSVIMVTAIDDRDTARRALALGASDYITKPLTLDFLESVLAVHVPGILPAQSPGDSVPGQRAAGPIDSAPLGFLARR